ncbi:MAG: replicative DNA helicase, partial [Bacteroidales bacterium]|nr:replicative DNA helicase [Bacteroidales bacterium]
MPARKKEIKVDLPQLAVDMGRKPPQAIEIEEAVLAAMMLDADCINDVLESLTPDCFYNESNRKIFSAITAIASRNDKVDILTVADELTKTGDLEAVGGASYLSALSMKIGAAANTDYHTKILLQKFIQRELISISYRVQKQAFEDSMPVDDLLQFAQQEVFVLAERNMKRDTSPIQMVINQAIDDIQKGQERQDGLSGVPSGYANIDKITYGWQPSDLI